MKNEDIQQLRQEISEIRSKHFSANTPQIKLDYMKQEKRNVREQLVEVLDSENTREWARNISKNRIEQQVNNARLSQETRTGRNCGKHCNEKYAAHEDNTRSWTCGGKAELLIGMRMTRTPSADFFDTEWMFRCERRVWTLLLEIRPYIRP